MTSLRATWEITRTSASCGSRAQVVDGGEGVCRPAGSSQQSHRRTVNRHDFPVPEAFVERQIESTVEQHLRGLAARALIREAKPGLGKD